MGKIKYFLKRNSALISNSLPTMSILSLGLQREQYLVTKTENLTNHKNERVNKLNK